MNVKNTCLHARFSGRGKRIMYFWYICTEAQKCKSNLKKTKLLNNDTKLLNNETKILKKCTNLLNNETNY